HGDGEISADKRAGGGLPGASRPLSGGTGSPGSPPRHGPGDNRQAGAGARGGRLGRPAAPPASLPRRTYRTLGRTRPAVAELAETPPRTEGARPGPATSGGA